MLRKAAEYDAVDIRCRGQRFDGRSYGNTGRTVGGKSIDAGGNRRKGNGGKAVLLAQFDGTSVTRRQRLVDSGASPVPNRPDGMNDMARRQAITPGDFGAAGLAAVEGAAFREQLWPRRAMDRAIDAAPAEQGRIGGVDDGVNA
jgi:hypothetical protein